MEKEKKCKDCEFKQFITMLKGVWEKNSPIYNIPSPYEELTKSEIKTLKLYAKDFPINEIADMLCISPGTANTHLSNMSEKLEMPRRELKRYAFQAGLITHEEYCECPDKLNIREFLKTD